MKLKEAKKILKDNQIFYSTYFDLNNKLVNDRLGAYILTDEVKEAINRVKHYIFFGI